MEISDVKEARDYLLSLKASRMLPITKGDFVSELEKETGKDTIKIYDLAIQLLTLYSGNKICEAATEEEIRKVIEDYTWVKRGDSDIRFMKIEDIARVAKALVGKIPAHTKEESKKVKRLEKALGRLCDEVAFVISGGDDPHDACPSCGLAGIGMMRDALADYKEALLR